MNLQALKEQANDNIELIFEAFDVELVDRGDFLQGCCPIHGGDNPTAFSWVKDRAYFRCFTRHCERDGADVFDFVQKFKHCTLAQAKEIVASIVIDENYKETPEAQLTADAKFKQHIRKNYKSPKNFQIFNPNCLEKLKTPEYLLSRGFSPDVLNEFNVGYCDNPRSEYYNRDCIPIYHHDGPLVGFTGRIIYEDYAERQVAKWYHTPGLLKGQTLFNLHRAREAIRKTHKAIVVEGPLDVLKCWEAGIHNVVAVLGSDLSGPQRSLLLAAECYDLILAFDNDKAGIKSTNTIKESCKNYFHIYQYILPEGKDIGDLTVEEVKNLDIILL